MIRTRFDGPDAVIVRHEQKNWKSSRQSLMRHLNAAIVAKSHPGVRHAIKVQFLLSYDEQDSNP